MSNLADDLLIHHFIVICDSLFLMEREGERGGRRRRVLGGKFVFYGYLYFRLKILKRM